MMHAELGANEELRVVVLTQNQATSWAVINSLPPELAVTAVVVEHFRARKLLPYRLRRLGWWKVLGQVVFVALEPALRRRGTDAHITQLLAGHDTTRPNNVRRWLEVEDVNDPRCQALLQQARPEVVLVLGTGLIRRRLLDLGVPFVNLHVGITPHFRGVHGGFWAVRKGRPDLVGTTVHRIDTGVDTGAVLWQGDVAVDPRRDDYRSLPVKQTLAALQALPDALRRAATDDPGNSPIGESRQWFTPTLLDYAAFRIRLRQWRNSGGI